MNLEPLAFVVFLSFCLLIAASLTVWTAFTTQGGEHEQRSDSDRGDGGGRVGRAGAARPVRERPAPTEPRVRGGRAAPAEAANTRPAAANAGAAGSASVAEAPVRSDRGQRRPSKGARDSEEDAFERFLKARPDDFDLR